MSYSIKTEDDSIELGVNNQVLAEFTFCNRVEGHIDEFDKPVLRLHSSQLLALAKFFIDAAEDRAEEEMKQVENEINTQSLKNDLEQGVNDV